MLTSLLPPDQLARIGDLAAHTPPGEFAELGVYRGGTAERLYAIAEAQGRTLHLFDTFAGHQDVSGLHDDMTKHWMGRYADGIRPEDLQVAFPHAVIHAGRFPETWTPEIRFAFVHCDMDLYVPTKAACRLVPRSLVPGGLIVFDDYTEPDCPGVTQAVDEAFGPGAAEGRARVIRTARVLPAGSDAGAVGRVDTLYQPGAMN